MLLEFFVSRTSFTLAIVLGLAVAACDRGTSEDAQESSASSVPTGEIDTSEAGALMPAVNLSNPDGRTLNLGALQGTPVLLNLWATWCAPCVKEMPSFETLYRRFRSQGLTVLAVSLDKDRSAKVQEFVDKYKLSFPVLLDTEGVAEKLYPSFTIPFTYVLDKQGRVAARIVF